MTKPFSFDLEWSVKRRPPDVLILINNDVV